jgi:pimeloyl-ACP methyl ester carboxylesterase
MPKKWLLAIPVILVVLYLAGPTPATPRYSKALPVVPSRPGELDHFVQSGEAQHKIKPDNQARIVWANDSAKQPTPFALVYLHGFTASQGEGMPVHRDMAKEFGCNLYLSRLSEHGIDTVDQLLRMTADNLWESAKTALAIGKKLGKKVILIGTSTGGTLALQLAATYPQDVAGLILLSPNIAINDPNAWVLNNPWGLQIARLIKKSKYIFSDDTLGKLGQYWNTVYRLEAAVELEELLETTMTKKTFEKVKQPTLLLYYYRDEVHQDSTVKVSAMLRMFDQLGTPAGVKWKQAIPQAGNHVLGSSLKSGDVPAVEREIEKFMKAEFLKDL